MVHELPSSQDVTQLPSQVSPASTIPLPQVEEQSASLALSQPGGQQPSPVRHAVIVWWLQAALQDAAAPVKESMVHELPSSQDVTQLPSQVSPASTIPLPQLDEQSLSASLVQPPGQQPSPARQSTITWCVHAALQEETAPVIVSLEHAVPS
jgi:hypothetical protein